jgi:Fe-S-cluster containining protein
MLIPEIGPGRSAGLALRDDIATEIRRVGFSCTGCGRCCRPDQKEPHIVLVSPAEVREICAGTGKQWHDLAEPYPEWIASPGGGRFTLAWCMKNQEGRCCFLSGGRCRIYSCRPWICRTYPFMLDEAGLFISPCPGIGAPVSWEDAYTLASTVMDRYAAECGEEERVKEQVAGIHIPPGVTAVIDGDGMTILHG